MEAHAYSLRQKTYTLIWLTAQLDTGALTYLSDQQTCCASPALDESLGDPNSIQCFATLRCFATLCLEEYSRTAQDDLLNDAAVLLNSKHLVLLQSFHIWVQHCPLRHHYRCIAYDPTFDPFAYSLRLLFHLIELAGQDYAHVPDHEAEED
jgi:hypothetical protein